MDFTKELTDFPTAVHKTIYAAARETTPLEAFLGGEKLNGMKQKYPAKTKSIISRTRNSVSRYMELLAYVGFAGKIEGDSLQFDDDFFVAAEKRVNSSVSPISLEKRLLALSRVGICRKTAQLR